MLLSVSLLPSALAGFLLLTSRAVQASCHCPPQPPWASSKVRLAWVPYLGGLAATEELRIAFGKGECPCNCQLPAERMENDC